MKLSAKSLLSVACLTAMCSAAMAQPYCEALLDADALDKKYKRLAPIFSSQDTGWIFTSDQLDETYKMKPEAERLFRQIVTEFQAADVTLAVVIAPPRPVIAGQNVVDRTLGADGTYDVANAAASFQVMLSQIRDAGAIAPDLMDVAMSSDDYFFRRDTHWTNAGAARSIDALADLLVPSRVVLDPATLGIIANETERGSLSDIVEASCGARDTPERTKIFDYASLRSGGDLLMDTSHLTSVALVGTSFSNRYKRDSYQVADALATALDANVENFSKSGGGSIGAIEAYVLSGALSIRSHDIVVWEFPYTESLNSTSALYQLLGAMRVSRDMSAGETITLDANATSDVVVSASDQPDLMVVTDLPDSFRKVYVDVMFANGKKKTLKLRRKPAFAGQAGSDLVAADLSGFGNRIITSMSLRFGPELAGQKVGLSFGS